MYSTITSNLVYYHTTNIPIVAEPAGTITSVLFFLLSGEKQGKAIWAECPLLLFNVRMFSPGQGGFYVLLM